VGRKGYSAETIPTNDDTETLIQQAIMRDDIGHSLSEALSDFLHMCVQTVCAHGEAFYEIVYCGSKSDKPEDFLLVPIVPELMERTANGWRLHIPEGAIARQERTDEAYEIPAENIVHFQLPIPIRAKWLKFLEALVVLGRQSSDALAFMDPKAQKPFPYDLTEHLRSHRVALAQITGSIGWSGRRLATEDMLEFYELSRLIRFEGFRIQLRDALLAQLNEGLRKAGKKLGFEAQIVVHGVPQLQDILNAQRELAEGTVATFKELIEHVR
jgi:hypothetical protein